MNIYHKSCSICNITKPVSDFYRDSRVKSGGYTARCKSCVKEKARNNYNKNSDIFNNNAKQYYKQNIEKVKAYREKTKEKRRNYGNAYVTIKKQTDPLFRLRSNMRSLIRNAIIKRGFKKQSKTAEILGCSFEQFLTHIENQFTAGMNWNNRHLWHIDHIVPISVGTTAEEVVKLNHYSNLRPLWAKENLQKSNKLIQS